MARRGNNFEDFFRGFNLGYSTVGGVLADREIRNLEDEQVEDYSGDEQGRYAKSMGLDPRGQQARDLYEQDKGFSDGAMTQDDVSRTASSLNSNRGDTTRANAAGVDKGYWYLNQGFADRPSDDTQDWMRDRAAAKVYNKYGLREMARQSRADARSGRRDALASEASALQLKGLQRNERVQGSLEALNQSYRAALSGDLQTAAEFIRGGLPGFNRDDKNPGTAGMTPDGETFFFLDPNGNAQSIPFKQMTENQRAELLQKAYLYQKAAIDGDMSGLIGQQNTDRAFNESVRQFGLKHKLDERELASLDKYRTGMAGAANAKSMEDWQAAQAYLDKGLNVPYMLWAKLRKDQLTGDEKRDRALYTADMATARQSMLGAASDRPGALPDAEKPPQKLGLTASIEAEKASRDSAAATAAQAKQDAVVGDKILEAVYRAPTYEAALNIAKANAELLERLGTPGTDNYRIYNRIEMILRQRAKKGN